MGVSLPLFVVVFICALLGLFMLAYLIAVGIEYICFRTNRAGGDGAGWGADEAHGPQRPHVFKLIHPPKAQTQAEAPAKIDMEVYLNCFYVNLELRFTWDNHTWTLVGL